MNEKKRIVITGASGFVGSRFYHFLNRDGGYHFESVKKYEVSAPTHQEMDLTDGKSVKNYIERTEPDIVLHCAAISNTWTCQQNPILSRTVNVMGTAAIGMACKKLGAKMIFMSSDQVYNGEIGMEPHKEDEVLFPSNIYGKHKLEAEQRLMDMGTDAICLRLTWMFEHPNAGGMINQNIIGNVWNALERNEPILAPIHEYRGITYIHPVIENIEKVLTLPHGIYNYGSECSTNTYETMGFVFDAMGKKLDKERLLFPDRERYAEQPRNLSMNIEKIKQWGITFPNTLQGILQCIQWNG